MNSTVRTLCMATIYYEIVTMNNTVIPCVWHNLLLYSHNEQHSEDLVYFKPEIQSSILPLFSCPVAQACRRQRVHTSCSCPWSIPLSMDLSTCRASLCRHWSVRFSWAWGCWWSWRPKLFRPKCSSKAQCAQETLTPRTCVRYAVMIVV